MLYVVLVELVVLLELVAPVLPAVLIVPVVLVVPVVPVVHVVPVVPVVLVDPWIIPFINRLRSHFEKFEILKILKILKNVRKISKSRKNSGQKFGQNFFFDFSESESSNSQKKAINFFLVPAPVEMGPKDPKKGHNWRNNFLPKRKKIPKISTINTLRFKAFLAKTNDSIFFKNPKTFIWGQKGPKRAKKGQRDFFFKKKFLSLFYVYDPLTSCKKAKKSNELFSLTCG